MTANPTPRLLEPKGARAVFYVSPGLEKSEDRIPIRLTYSAPVLHHVIPASPGAANGMPVGFSLVSCPDGATRVYSGPDSSFMGLVERGPRGWFRRFQLEREARKRAQAERAELKKNEEAAVIAAEILNQKEN